MQNFQRVTTNRSNFSQLLGRDHFYKETISNPHLNSLLLWIPESLPPKKEINGNVYSGGGEWVRVIGQGN